MNVGSFRRVPFGAVVLVAVCSTSCATKEARSARPPVFPKEHAVVLHAEKQGNGRWKAIATPDHLVVSGYLANSESVVLWAFRHKSTRITFKPSKPAIPDPTCDDASGECRLTLPKGLEPGVRYRYTIAGRYDDANELDPNDPDIEIDR